MPRKKNYKISNPVPAATPLAASGTELVQSKPASAKIIFAELLGPGVRAQWARGIDLTEWLGRGIDAWVIAAIDCYVAKLRSGTCQTLTVHNESRGLSQFFSFILDARPQPLLAHPNELKPLHVTQFVAWLLRRQRVRNLSSESTRTFYKGAKSTFVTMMEHGHIEGDPRRLFPPRVLPHKNYATARAQPYSDAEQQRIADALKADLIDLHHGHLKLAPSMVLATYFLIVAMRTGCNLTPLLELGRDAMAPGLLPGTQFLRLRKHRGARIVSRVLKEGECYGEPIVIPLDAVAVLQRALEETAELATLAQDHLKNRVWLFRSFDCHQSGVIKCLRRDMLKAATRGLAKRRNLLDDSGRPLLAVTTRFRQSLGMRAWRLSDGDPLAVAAVLGNTPRVAESNYLRIDDQLQSEAASYMGRELSAHLRTGPKARLIIPLIADDVTATTTLTPAGRCTDSLFGVHAPNDGGNHCDKFVMCLFCPSFGVAGEPADLWRIYSFQLYAQAELDRLVAIDRDRPSGVVNDDALLLLYEAAIPFIDRFCEQAFGREMCHLAKSQAQREMHPFWKHLMKCSMVRREGVALLDVEALEKSAKDMHLIGGTINE